jgi:hypothetical protein
LSARMWRGDDSHKSGQKGAQHLLKLSILWLVRISDFPRASNSFECALDSTTCFHFCVLRLRQESLPECNELQFLCETSVQTNAP